MQMRYPTLGGYHPGWDFSKTVLKNGNLRNIFKISMYNGGCNGVCLDNSSWCTKNHGLIAYGSSHMYGDSWMKIVNSK